MIFHPSSLSSSIPFGDTSLATEKPGCFSPTLFPAKEIRQGREERSASSLELPALASSPSPVRQETICKVTHCLSCRGYFYSDPSEIRCRYQGCSETSRDYWSYHYHLKADHHDLRIHCLQPNCKFSTKRLSDLRRHYTVKHCQAPEIFACPSSGCKYNGDNGFARKDKLMSHQRKMHKGENCAAPRSGPRAIQPAAPRSSMDPASDTSNADGRME